MKASIFTGTVIHQRYLPTKHGFTYDYGVYGLPLRGSEADMNDLIRKSGLRGRFRRRDYFGDHDLPLNEAVLEKASELYGSDISGEVFFLGQVSHWGFCYSPVNFYVIYAEEFKLDSAKYLLAEVTNTPWHEKHCYLVSLDSQPIHQKQFHVSPFNPIEMTYHWINSIKSEKICIQINCRQKAIDFMAKMEITPNSSLRQLSPLIWLNIIFRIYYQAFLLFIKRTPVYAHPKTEGQK